MIIRIVITIALLHPLSNLASTLYNGYIGPFLAQNEKRIDDKLDELAKEGKKKLVEGAE